VLIVVVAAATRAAGLAVLAVALHNLGLEYDVDGLTSRGVPASRRRSSRSACRPPCLAAASLRQQHQADD
jgi:hypothetical protein